MHRKDRERIDRYCESIVPELDMTKLLPKLLEDGVYNSDDVNIPRWTRSLHARETIEDIYLTIKTRGPNAFKNFIHSLRQTNHGNAANILEEQIAASNSISSKQPNHESIAGALEEKNNNTRQEDIPLEHDICSDEPLTIKLRKATKFLDREFNKHEHIERYPMRSKPRGLVLIITNIYYKSPDEKPRFSAKHDTDNLKKLFEEMGFLVIIRGDLTGQEIKNEVKKFSERSDLKTVDSCFVIVTSHGTEDEDNNTEIQGTDYSDTSRQANYQKVLCTELYDYFTTEACPQLAEKPKIFIFQLCRGKKVQKGVSHFRISTDTCVIPNTKQTSQLDVDIPRNQTIRNYSDMLVVQSTLPGYVSYRDNITGSWFIQILCKVFMNYACTNHIQDLFSMIDAKLKYLRTTQNECQTPTIKMMGFNKHCYINPGLFEDTVMKEE